MILNKKHLLIIETLKKQNISIDKLSHKLSISQRTLTNYINQLQIYFEGSISIFKQNKSLSMIVTDEMKFLNLIKDLEFQVYNHLDEIEERGENIFHYLLYNGVCTIDDIAEDLFLSKSVVNNKINEIKNLLEGYRVNIRGTQNVGLRIEGNELEVRKVLIELFNRQYSSHTLPGSIYAILNETKRQYNLDNATFERLITATKVVLSRIENGYEISQKVQIDDSVFESKDFIALSEIRDYLIQHYSVKFPNLEILQIVFQIIGRRASLLDEFISEDDQSTLNRIIQQTIDDIDFYYTIKIDDELFSTDIQLHIKYLINRLIFDIRIQSDFIDEVENKYPFAYELSKVLATNIEKEIKIKVPLNELGFLSIYFSVYLQQLEQKFKEIHSVAFITNQGLSSVKLMKIQLQKIFGNQIMIDVINENELNQFQIDNYDLIVSTIKINRLFNRIIYIDNILDEQALKLKIEQFMIYKDVSNKKLFNKSIIVDFLTEQDVYHVNKNMTYEKVIAYLSNELINENRVDHTFITKILEREKHKSTITGALGFPHTSHLYHGIWLKLAIVNQPLQDCETVKLVVLVATPEAEVNEAVLIRLYEEILAITTNSYIINQICKDTDYITLAHILNNEMRV
ncbi:BglG family transcription antiterminator [Staphylococcus sp. KG4-3]|uniref:PRD domain-containing protein n=1 Tax=Staphylococcus xylosus TaxID=1288 RepID=A0A418ILK8_STAXY|nr:MULTISPECIES: PRD domain-containing protein [Staphylococcus]MDW8543426.1 PRD domain-containing protein [Staphylococcus sp. KG4-1]MDW8562850.1 PRD domain-containing protein [Staphylococcus sp. KG4-3]RIN09006.1 PRD domain-containing protein [Staphylococcus xylosus]